MMEKSQVADEQDGANNLKAVGRPQIRAASPTPFPQVCVPLPISAQKLQSEVDQTNDGKMSEAIKLWLQPDPLAGNLPPDCFSGQILTAPNPIWQVLKPITTIHMETGLNFYGHAAGRVAQAGQPVWETQIDSAANGSFWNTFDIRVPGMYMFALYAARHSISDPKSYTVKLEARNSQISAPLTLVRYTRPMGSHRELTIWYFDNTPPS